VTLILIVEDDEDIRESLHFLLETEGYAVKSTGSGREALTLVSRHHVDLVLLDVEVEHLAGLGAARALRDFSDVPVAVMSARTLPWVAEALRAGATACVPKPFHIESLLRLIAHLTAHGRPPTAWPSDVRRLGEEELRAIRSLPRQVLDALPFGAIAVDAAGRVVEFNKYEAEATTFERASILGRRFSDIAPCTQVKQFAGAMEEGFTHGHLDTVLRFTFPYGNSWSVVTIRLYYDEEAGRMWVFVSRAAQLRVEAPLGIAPSQP
jgi:photoactive yellow protein